VCSFWQEVFSNTLISLCETAKDADERCHHHWSSSRSPTPWARERRPCGMVHMRLVPLLFVATCAALQSPLMRVGDGSVTRRQAILLPAAAAAAASSLDRAIAADDITASIEKIVPMATLTAQLSAAAPRNIIITGANSGVGLAGAKILTAAGHRVTLACRTQAKADAAAAACMEWSGSHATRSGGIAKGAECDLASLESIRRFAESCKGSPLDSLVLNAGLARGTAETDVKRTAEGFEETIGVNHLGHFYLASLLLPTLAASSKKPPRLVITASPVTAVREQRR